MLNITRWWKTFKIRHFKNILIIDFAFLILNRQNHTISRMLMAQQHRIRFSETVEKGALIFPLSGKTNISLFILNVGF